MGRHVIGAAADLPPGTNRILTVEGRSVGVFNVSGTYYALKNSCPHQG
ncbi:Rieske 2Fe-2S domain-containing protein, partial [Paenibacillus sepulcri]|nr:Rieske 2Fe-2S domain-containing protein [Paenibacillus sepulcri]